MSADFKNWPAALIVRLDSVAPHPNAERLDVLTFTAPVRYQDYGRNRVQLVAGKHYQAPSLGVWFLPGTLLPGYMAEEMWLQKGSRWFEVREFPIRGQLSSGIFAGEVWRKDEASPFEKWRFWKSSWCPGDDVSDYFGITRPLSSGVERSVLNREVAVPDSDLVGASPAVGSNPLPTPEEKTDEEG